MAVIRTNQLYNARFYSEQANSFVSYTEGSFWIIQARKVWEEELGEYVIEEGRSTRVSENAMEEFLQGYKDWRYE